MVDRQTDRQISQKIRIAAFPLVKCTRRWAVDYFGLGLMQVDSLFIKICTKNDFLMFQLYIVLNFPVTWDLDLCPFDHEFTIPVTCESVSV